MKALITNDDGIDSIGLHRLAGAAYAAGLEVVVAAPVEEASGSSAALTAVEEDGRVVVTDRDLPDLDGIKAYAVAAPPAFIALIATRGAFGRAPDVILSGINRGANTGRAILHSGTVGAALTAAANGCPAMAYSLDVGLTPGQTLYWETAAGLLEILLPLAVDPGRAVVVNVNVPNVAPDDLRGVRRARLARFGVVQTNIAEAGQGFVRVAVTDHDARREPGTDAALLGDGYATVTPLQPVCEAEATPLHLPRP